MFLYVDAHLYQQNHGNILSRFGVECFLILVHIKIAKFKVRVQKSGGNMFLNVKAHFKAILWERVQQF